jgi:hypothetical protein
VSGRPLHPTAEAVLGTGPAWTPADLVAAMAGQTEGVTPGLAARFPSWGIEVSAPLDTELLLAAAQRESEHLSS